MAKLKAAFLAKDNEALDYSVVGLIVSAFYGILKQYLPDFPIDEATFQILIGYILIKLGVIVAPAVKGKLVGWLNKK